MAEDNKPSEENVVDNRKVYAVRVFCSGPAEFYISDEDLIFSEDSHSFAAGASLNGGIVLSIYDFCGQLGIPRDVPFEIVSDDIISGAFGSPGSIEVYGGIVTAIDERLALAVRGNPEHDLYIGEDKIHHEPSEPDLVDDEERRSLIYESEDGLLKRLQLRIRYGLKSPGIRKDEGGYTRVDRRYPPLPDVTVRCAANRTILIEGSNDIYANRVSIPCENPSAKTLDDMPNILNLVREHVRA